MLQEFFDLGSSVDPLYENLWVPETDLPGFRQFCESFYGKCFIIRAEMLRAIARGLKVELDLFERKCDTNVHSLRLLHYPACDIQTLKNGTKRVSEHSDTSVITLLFQDAVGGLEVEDRNSPGTFLPLAKAQGEEIILNVGDYMQRWTNGKLRSQVHRVVLPPSLMSSQDGRVEDRYSVVYFGKGNRETSAGPLEEFISEKNPAKYEDMTVMKYAQTKYKYLFAKQA